MRIIICEPQKHPRVADIEHTLGSLQKIVGGCIEVLYPYDEPVAVVCNECFLFEDLDWNRVVDPYGPIKGTFFVAGLSEDSFCDLTNEQIEKYKALFWNPELLIPTPGGMARIIVQD